MTTLRQLGVCTKEKGKKEVERKLANHKTISKTHRRGTKTRTNSNTLRDSSAENMLLLNCNANYARAGTPYNGLYGEAPPERGTFLRLEVYKRVGISRIEV